jgi:hypothetical protein
MKETTVKRTLLGIAFGGLLAASVTIVAPVAKADGIFTICPSGVSGVATTVTSCAFADNVRSTWIRSGGSSLIQAYSPVTNTYYEMQCSADFTATLNSGRTVQAIRCSGGNNAVVIAW